MDSVWRKPGLSNKDSAMLKDPEVISRFQPIMAEYAILAEYNTIHQHWKSLQLQDVFVIPSANNPLHWFGVLFIKQGIYEGGIFRFHVYVDEDLASGNCPKVIFPLPVFHPQVDPVHGYLETKSVFPRWEQGIHHMWDLLLHVKRTIKTVNVDNALNHEAAELFLTDLEEFKHQAKESVASSRAALYDTNADSQDPHYLRFSVYNENIHGVFRKAILNIKKDPHTKPLSWISPGSLEPCSAMTELDSSSNS